MEVVTGGKMKKEGMLIIKLIAVMSIIYIVSYTIGFQLTGIVYIFTYNKVCEVEAVVEDITYERGTGGGLYFTYVKYNYGEQEYTEKLLTDVRDKIGDVIHLHVLPKHPWIILRNYVVICPFTWNYVIIIFMLCYLTWTVIQCKKYGRGE